MVDHDEPIRQLLRARLRELAAAADPGARLPGERDLAARWGVARMTLRNAMDGLIAEGILDATRSVPGVEEVEAELTFDPPWTPDRMSDDAKFILGFG